MSSEIAISVRKLTKTYRLFGRPGDRIKQFFSLGLRRYHHEFTALKDVSFDVKKGETVGIIGRNGSGKSTLLQLICGILKPTSGTLTVNGRVSALLELGAGFNPEFTGRENVYFQGALQGFTKEQMNERFDAIAAFADIGEFIDQPVRTYSSGMFVRLAFAAAIHVDPDILVVDEALAVGDLAFQVKCFSRLTELRRQSGLTLVFVSHSAEQVVHQSSTAIMLTDGVVRDIGAPDLVMSHYMKSVFDDSRMPSAATPTPDGFASHPAYSAQEVRWGDGAAHIVDLRFTQDGKQIGTVLLPYSLVSVRLTLRFNEDVNSPVFGMTIKNADGAILGSINSRENWFGRDLPRPRAGDVILIQFRFHPYLAHGVYLFSFGVASDETTGLIAHDRRYDSIRLRVDHPESWGDQSLVDGAVSLADDLQDHT